MTTRTLLVAFAHPDDETVGAGGTIARYAGDGRTRVVVVIATRGQAATFGVELAGSREALGPLRERELHEATSILGVHAVHLLDHQDGKLADVAPDRIRGELVEIVRRERPDVVITFDLNGTNGHPDHIAIGRFVTDAVAAARDPRWRPGPAASEPHVVRRLLWTTPTSVWSALRAAPDENPFAVLARAPGTDYLIDTRAEVEVKRRALDAHRSQQGAIEKHILGHGDDRRVLSAETFRHVWGTPPATCPASCVFEGLA